MTSDQFSALSDSLFSASIIIYALAALAFCAELAFGRRAARPGRELAAVGAGTALSAPEDGARSPSAPAAPAASAGRRWGLLGAGLTGVGALANAGVLIARSAATGRVPWGNMYEFATASVLAGVIVYLCSHSGCRRCDASGPSCWGPWPSGWC